MLYINTILLEHYIYIHLIIITCIAIPGNKLLCLMSYVLNYLSPFSLQLKLWLLMEAHDVL